ncbi:lycopene cyclase [Psychroflexus sp. S27]|uniref:lycopene cyclase family protein n=1 Tax=Psychroflexus sp. S27 TaxID=1982757 RepID=UPI000C29B21D|nr:lycopene cyclase family protein [Psychroflexus sp. S27]PJX23269.1 lycopene cyclase [Psychroflexus sp. S27]
MFTFDYIIVGAGAAGLHLSMAMKRNGLLNKKKLLIIEPSTKNSDDKTWCFWEKKSGLWDDFITKSWSKGELRANKESIEFDLDKYKYKMLRSIDFYKACKNQILEDENIEWVQEKVIDYRETNKEVIVKTNTNSYNTELMFDSRISPEFYKPNNSIHIHQHFKGWYIKTEENTFDNELFTMMDFDIKDQNTTSFTYVLPINRKEALVEFTYFSPDIVSDETYNRHLKKYLEHIKINNYQVVSEEKGVIPMSSFDFDNFQSKRIYKIGTAAGWVKASTGYAFKNCERKSEEIVNCLLNNKNLSDLKKPLKYKHYDKMFLDVLKSRNDFGEELFYRMYKKNPIERIFRFLDEESSFSEDFKIILSLNSKPFHQAFIRHLKRGFKTN